MRIKQVRENARPDQTGDSLHIRETISEAHLFKGKAYSTVLKQATGEVGGNEARKKISEFNR